MGLALICFSVLLLMYLAYRGYSIVLFAPLFAILASIGSGYGPMPVYSEIYMTKAAEYIKIYFPVFLLGAVFAKMMEEGGLANSIASSIIRFLGREKAILAVLIGCGVLSYGGISVFVVVFVMYPFTAILFRQAGIPKRLIPATLWAGSFTYAMSALPGSPQIQNILPTAYLGTTTWSAPILGLFGAAAYFLIGWLWISHRFKKLSRQGEGYGSHVQNEPLPFEEKQPLHWTIAAIPLAVVVIINLFISNPFNWSWGFHWNSQLLEPLKGLKLSLFNPNIERVRAIWSLIIALSAGIICTAFIGRKQFMKFSYIKPLNTGVQSSITAVLNIASGYAFGSVITNLPAFGTVKDALLHLKVGASPLLSAIVTTDIMVAFSGGASAGITIALDTLSREWLAMAQSIGMPPEVLHRIICLASAGPDSVPHAGSMVTIMMVCGLTHKDSYYDLFVLLLLNSSVAYICMFFYYLTGLV